MTKGALKSLTLKHLRGSTTPFTLYFEKGKKLTIIYGENGTGKSTICDGLEFLGKGRVGSIENRGLGRVNQYWSSVGKANKDISVVLETSAGNCQAYMGRNDVVAHPPEQRPRVEVLRRTQVLSLVEATAANRYAAISRFIDVSEIEASEAALRTLVKDTEREIELTLTRIDENRNVIQEFCKQAGRPQTDYLQWAENEIRQDHADNAAELKILNGLQQAFAQISSLAKEISKTEKNLAEVVEARNAAADRLDEYLTAESMGDANIVKLLEAARTYLKRQPYIDVCPVCQSSEEVDDLVFRIEERLLAMARLKEAQETLQTEQSEVQFIERQLSEIEITATQQIISFEDYCRQAAVYSGILLPKTPIPETSKEWPQWLASNTWLPGKWKNAEREYQDKTRFYATLERALAITQENSRTYHELNALLIKLKRALEIVVTKRHQFTDHMLGAISADVGRLYEMVHPRENLNQIKLQLEPNKRASLEIGAHFEGKMTPPQAYYSESHLDTLGLCVFMALAALDSPEDTILVLDDVLASVDEPHIDRLIEMLYQESTKYRHCLITTHYRPWKNKLRWGWLKNGQCQFVELTRWSLTEGLSLTQSIPDIERLRQLIDENPPDPQLICAKAGVVLEAALDFLTQQYECSIPRRPGGFYTLGDLLPAIDKKLRSALEVEVLAGRDETGTAIYQTVPLQPFIDELTRIAQARNVFGCHFNALSFDLLESDAMAFGKQVSALMEVLVDSTSGWPKNGNSGRYWATSGETRRLYPFKKPG